MYFYDLCALNAMMIFSNIGPFSVWKKEMFLVEFFPFFVFCLVNLEKFVFKRNFTFTKGLWFGLLGWTGVVKFLVF